MLNTRPLVFRLTEMPAKRRSPSRSRPSHHMMMFMPRAGRDQPVYRRRGSIAKPSRAASSPRPALPRRWRSSIQISALPPKPGQPWFGSGHMARHRATEAGAVGGALHAEQHFEYHRALRPGDVLSVESRPGDTWERDSKRAGKLVFIERITEFRDQHGELVVTARSVGVRTERPVSQG